MDRTEYRAKSVLVIDDFANVRKSIKTMLNSLGFDTVYEAHNATTASRIAKDSRLDLVLCDFNLGPGRDGARLLEEWREHNTIDLQTIFVLITAETSREMVVSAMEYEPDDYLAKPFAMEVLSNRLTRWFARRKVLTPLLNAIDQQKWPEVTKISKSIMELHPRYRPEAQKHFVTSLIQTRQLTEAENFLHGILSKRFQSWAQTALHKIELIQEKMDLAEIGFREVLLKDPNLIEAYDYLAQTLQAQGKETDRQEVLDRAVHRSPHNISRQKILIESAHLNQDFKRMSLAYRDIISLSAGTMHESLTDFQLYVRNLQNELKNDADENRRREVQKELSSVNRRMNERYHSDINANLFSKALVVHNSETPTAEKHTRALNDLYNQLLEAQSDVSVETALFATEAFFMSTRFADGDDCVSRFKERFKHSETICQQFDELQMEPVSGQAKEKAKQLNVKGIELYKQQKYIASIECFVKALELSPRHPGIILNFIQSHLIQSSSEGMDSNLIKTCTRYLDRLNYLPTTHYQYERFTKIKQKLRKAT